MAEIIQSIIIYIIEMVLPGYKTLHDFNKEHAQLFYESGIKIWNALTGRALVVLLQAPSAASPEAYHIVNQIGGVLQGVSGSLLAALFLYRMMKEASVTRHQFDVKDAVKILLGLAIMEGIATNLGRIINQVIRIGSSLVSLVVSHGNGGLSMDPAVADVFSGAEPGFPTMIFTIVFFVMMTVLGAGVLITVVQRLIRLLIALPFAAVAVVTMMGGGRVSEVGYSYIRSFVGYCLEGAVIAMIIIIGNLLTSSGFISNAFSGIIVGSGDVAFWQVMVGGIGQLLGCSAISGTIKMSEHLVHKMFGL